MKKTLLLSTVVLAGAAFASVTSDNAIGVLDVTVKSGNNIIAVPFEAYSSSSDQSIQVADLVKTSDLPEGSKIYKVNSNDSTTYDCWRLNSDKTTWEPVKQYKISNGSLVEQTSDTATSVTIARGEAFWLVPAELSSSTTVYLMGQKASSGLVSKDITAPDSGMKWCIFGVSGTDSLNVSDIVSGTTHVGDMITLMDGTVYKCKNSGWKKTIDPVAGSCNEDVGADDVVAAGSCFWYTAKKVTGDGSKAITISL